MPKKNEINYKLIEEVIAAIRADRNRLRMTFWLIEDSASSEQSLETRAFRAMYNFRNNGAVPPNVCGTAGCAVGLAMMLRPDEAKEYREAALLKSKDGGSGFNDGTTAIFLDVGARLYGLPRGQADNLFVTWRWPAPYRTMDEDKGLVAILENIIAQRSADFLDDVR